MNRFPEVWGVGIRYDDLQHFGAKHTQAVGGVQVDVFTGGAAIWQHRQVVFVEGDTLGFNPKLTIDWAAIVVVRSRRCHVIPFRIARVHHGFV